MSYRALLSRPDARRYLAGQSLSLLGDSSMWMAAGIWVLTLTGSNGAAGLTFFFFLAPTVLAPLAGLLVDRLRKRFVLVVANLAGVAALLPLFAVHDADDVWLVYVVMALYGLVNVVTGPAQSALLTRMLPPDLLPSANSALRTAQESLRVLAPLLGAGLFALAGPRAVVLLDIGTFLAAAAFTLSLRIREPRPVPTRGHVVAEISAGLRFIAAHPVLRRATVSSVVLTLVLGFGESTTWAVISDGLDRPPEFVGIMQLAQGSGAIAGGVFAAMLIRRAGETRTAGLGVVLFAVGEALLVISELPVVLLGRMIAGAGFPLLIIAVITLMQRAAPDHLQGRVYAGFDLAATVPQTMSVALGAWLVGVLDYRLVLAAAAGVGLVSAVIMLRIKVPVVAPATSAVPAKTS